MNKSLVISIVLVALTISVGYWEYSSSKTRAFEDAIQASGSVSAVPGAHVMESVNLTMMLESGIATKQGILQSRQAMVNKIQLYQLILKQHKLGLIAASRIELVQAFILDEKQVLLFSYNQGGNSCSNLYRFLAISESSHYLSQQFGSCLPLSRLQASESAIFLQIPQNNPYLGPEVGVTYRFSGTELVEIAKAKPEVANGKLSKHNAHAIVEQARVDGCLVDGVFLLDNACRGGRKYCLMFKHLPKREHNADYRLVHDFCTN